MIEDFENFEDFDDLDSVWMKIGEFPNYLVNQYGDVINNQLKKTLGSTKNQRGIRYVSLYKENKLYVRALAKIVLQAFNPSTDRDFTTPIHLNGDRNDCNLENLMWRPRWFARSYHKQFDQNPIGRITVPILEFLTDEVSEGSLEAAMRYGLLEKDVIFSCRTANSKLLFDRTRREVFPTGQFFDYLEEFEKD